MNNISFEEVLSEHDNLLFKSVGISMLPLIREGRDYVNITKRPEGPLKKYDIALFRRPNNDGRDTYILHRVLKVCDNGSYWIVGDNCVSGETVENKYVVGVLSCLYRNGRVVQLRGLAYRLYVCLWCAPYPLRFLILRGLRAVRRLGGFLFRRLHLYPLYAFICNKMGRKYL